LAEADRIAFLKAMHEENAKDVDENTDQKSERVTIKRATG